MSEHQRQRRRPMSEINVVPYIDVMLVLLVIFMVTAPMMTQSVQVQLPTQSSPMQEKGRSEGAQVKVEIDAAGSFYLTLGTGSRELVDEAALQERVRTYLAQHAQAPVYVGGDGNVPYQRMMDAFGLLKQAGAANVGLLAQHRD